MVAGFVGVVRIRKKLRRITVPQRNRNPVCKLHHLQRHQSTGLMGPDSAGTATAATASSSTAARTATAAADGCKSW